VERRKEGKSGTISSSLPSNSVRGTPLFSTYSASPTMPPVPQPTPLGAETPHGLPPLPPSLSSSASSWIPTLALPASQYPPECFTKTLLSLVHSPEHSSSTILRADILSDQSFEEDSYSDLKGKGKEPIRDHEERFMLEGYELTRRIRRKILPKRPQFDNSMESECLFYTRQHTSSSNLSTLEDLTEVLVLFVVDLDSLEQETGKREPPYYHPQVSTLAFRYLPPALSTTPGLTSTTLRIDIVPLPGSSQRAPLDPQDRLFRTSLSLLKTIDKMSKGFNTGYEKRVYHDLLVPKEKVQDVYQTLKSKYSCVPFESSLLFRAFSK
jgi:tRNASer (uridine44-2'-O)-methyltransferase